MSEMTDPRRLSETALAAIGEELAAWHEWFSDPNKTWQERAQSAGEDAIWRMLDRAMDHAAFLAERLAEAERATRFQRERGDKATLDLANLAIKATDTAEKLAIERTAHKGTLERLTAQLATLCADHAATVTELRTAQTLSDNRQEWIDGYLKKQGYESDLATEKAARLAAEAGAVELRAALMTAHLNCGCEDGIRHKYDDDGSPIEVRCLQCAPILAALAATPSDGAAAVLAAASEWEAACQGQDDCVDAEIVLAEAVKAWRAAREGGKGG